MKRTNDFSYFLPLTPNDSTKGLQAFFLHCDFYMLWLSYPRIIRALPFSNKSFIYFYFFIYIHFDIKTLSQLFLSLYFKESGYPLNSNQKNDKKNDKFFSTKCKKNEENVQKNAKNTMKAKLKIN